jgi:hypothetical protein
MHFRTTTGEHISRKCPCEATYADTKQLYLFLAEKYNDPLKYVWQDKAAYVGIEQIIDFFAIKFQEVRNKMLAYQRREVLTHPHDHNEETACTLARIVEIPSFSELLTNDHDDMCVLTVDARLYDLASDTLSICPLSYFMRPSYDFISLVKGRDRDQFLKNPSLVPGYESLLTPVIDESAYLPADLTKVFEGEEPAISISRQKYIAQSDKAAAMDEKCTLREFAAICEYGPHYQVVHYLMSLFEKISIRPKSARDPWPIDYFCHNQVSILPFNHIYTMRTEWRLNIKAEPFDWEDPIPESTALVRVPVEPGAVEVLIEIEGIDFTGLNGNPYSAKFLLHRTSREWLIHSIRTSNN